VSATDDMRELLDRMYDSFASGDPTVWTDNVADDVLGIGTDADEWWEGRSLIAKVALAIHSDLVGACAGTEKGAPDLGECGCRSQHSAVIEEHLSGWTSLPRGPGI